jgi:glycosyltransferase involved in cell wall biosynthesis
MQVLGTEFGSGMMHPAKFKIGFAGNTNNYPYTLALAFSKLGHNVKFIVYSEEKLHRPENRFNESENPDLEILDVSPLSFGYWSESDAVKERKIVDFLADRDLVILNGNLISWYKKINRPHITLLTGSDLDFLASEKYVETFKLKQFREREPLNFKPYANAILKGLSGVIPSGQILNRFVYSKNRYFSLLGSFKILRQTEKRKRLQANGIKNSPFITYFPPGLVNTGDSVLQQIGAGDIPRVFNLMTDTSNINYRPQPNKGTSVRIFNLARFTWVKKENQSFLSTLDFKGNDIMLRGISLFVRKNPGTDLLIVLVRKGIHLQETYELIEKLNIAHVIAWKDELSQSEVLEEYEKADIVFDQFGTSVVGMGGLDAMAVGRPLIANWRPEFFEKYVGNWPVCQAATDEEVCRWLEKLVFDPLLRLQIGKRSREFVEEKLSSKAFAERILKAIEEYHVLEKQKTSLQ